MLGNNAQLANLLDWLPEGDLVSKRSAGLGGLVSRLACLP